MSIADTIVPDVIQRNFLAKVIVGVIVIMVLTGAVGVFFYTGISSDLDDQVNRQVEATTVQHGHAFSNWFENRFNEIETSAVELEDRGDPDQLSAQDIWTVLQAKQGEYDDIKNLYYVDTESGEVLGGSSEEFEGTNVYDDLGFAPQDFESDEFILPRTYDSQDGEEVMALGIQSPLRGSGIVLAEISADAGGPILAHGYQDALTGVVTDEGETLLRNDPDITMPDISSPERVTRAESGSHIYAYRQVEPYDDLFVVTETPKSSAFELSNSVLQNFGLTLVFALVILIGVTFVGGRSAIRDLDTLANRTETMGEGDLDVDLETSRRDEIGVLYNEFDEMRDDLKERIQEAEQARDEAESARKEAEVARAEAEEMADYLQEKAEEYSEIMQEVSMGDLTQRMTADGEEESMDRIAEEFNEMIEELEKTTGQLKSYVDEVEEAGSEVEQSAETVREASEQVADSIQKISDGAYDQKERLQNVSETMDMVTDDLETLAGEHDDADISEALDHIREVAGEVSDIAELSEETMAETQHVAGAAEEQAAELNEVSERANDLQRYAQPLRDILERFQTEAEHEFVFSVGPTGGAESPGSRLDDE